MYEIPQQLEYKEKIIFGLTFEQLVYAMIFFPIIFMIIFRVNASLTTRIAIAFFPFLLACGFIFLNLQFHLKNWIIWFKSRKIETKERMEKWFYIKEIKNSLIVTKNKKIAVLKVEPVNFSIKPAGEQEAIILAFQKFLNSLDFPIQLLMTTETLNLEEYLSKLKENIDESKSGVFDEYKEHIKKVIRDNSVMNRNFYIAIPETSNIDIQVKICEDRLNGLNLKTSRLNDLELGSIVRKICSTSEQLLPKKIENQLDFLKIDNKLLTRVIYAHGYPRIVEAGFLDRIVSCSGNFDLIIKNLSKKYNREFKRQLKGSDLEKIAEEITKALQKDSNSNP